MSGQLCTEGAAMGWAPWAMLVFYGVILGFVFLRRVIFGQGRGRPVRFLPLVLGASFAIGMILAIRGGDNGGFQEFRTDASTVSLSYFWPKAKDTVSLAAIDSIAVVRGRHFSKKNRTADRAWLKIKAGQGTYFSCETASIAAMSAAGRMLATTTGKPVTWQERCPDPANKAVPATEDLVNAPGRMEIPAACASGSP